MTPKQTHSPFLRSLQRLQLAFWQRRVARWFVRAAWMALLVPTIFMAGYLWLGWDVVWYEWLLPMLLVGFLSVLWSMRPIGLRKIAHRLDDRLGLRAQLLTAFEVSHKSDADDPDNPVVQQLLHGTVNIIVRLRRQVRLLNQGLWLEIQTLIAVAALFSALLMLDALTARTPNAPLVDLPPAGQEPTAEEVLPPDPQLQPPPLQSEIQTQGGSANQIQEALQALADALRDQAATRPVSDAIDQNDLGTAAEELRRLADQLEDLSQQAQSELGDALQEAADNIGGDAPSLTEPLQAGSQALGQNNTGGGQQALEDLAEALDRIQQAQQQTAQAEGEPQQGQGEEQQQQSPSEQSEGAGAGEGNSDADGSQQPPPEDERLAIEGEPLELENDPPEDLDERVLQPAELDAQASDERTQDSPFARRSLNAATDLGPDPLTYPWEKRDIIRRYFTPE
jgi:hypothetical protein